MITQSLGKYRIKKWLGGGAFGDVYLAVDTIIEKDFALKVSRLRKKDIQLLKDEAKLLASLEHPHIVRFYNVDEIEGKLVLVMEYVEGTSLREIIDRGKLPYDKAVNIIAQVLDALSYAHSRGAIHRDVKPENILLSKDERVKITDFGLARFIKEGSLSASMAGTPLYMPPESWKGKFSIESDIYSTGVVLYEMLTGVNPFIADSFDGIRSRVLSGIKEAPSRHNPSVPCELDSVVMRAVEVEPLKRFRSADEFKRILLEVSSSIPFVVVKNVSDEADGITLIPAQEEVVKSDEKRLLLAGSAGAGKTTVLIHRVAHFLKKRGFSPLNILVLTFTRKSTSDLKERLDVIAGSEGRDVTVDTFHGFGEKVLRADGEEVDLQEDFEVIEPLSHAVFNHMQKKFGKRARLLFSKVENMKAELIGSEDERAGNTAEVQAFYREYERMKKERNLLDYGDLIFLAVRVLKSERGVKYRERFRYIFVDEFQDLNRAQYEMVKSLIGEHTYLFITGDDNQSIYRWRGARREYMRRIASEVEGIKKVVLTASFRLPEKHILVARNLMRRRDGREVAELPSMSMIEREGKVEFYKAVSPEDEAEFVIRKVKEGISNQRTFSDFAILMRVNHYSRVFEERFSLHSIPFSFVGMKSFYHMEEVKLFVDVLDAISKKEISLLPALLNRLIKSKVYVFSSSGYEVVVHHKKEKNSKVPERVRKLCDFLNCVIEDVNQWAPKDIIEGIVESAGYIKGKMSVRMARRRENVQELMMSAQRFGRGETAQFVRYVKLMEDLEVVDWKKNSVKMLTVHASKGLEFPVVFVVGLIEDIFPLVKSFGGREEMEEERRLLYVAITRATEELYLSFPAKYRRRPVKPSRYLLDMTGM